MSLLAVTRIFPYRSPHSWYDRRTRASLSDCAGATRAAKQPICSVCIRELHLPVPTSLNVTKCGSQTASDGRLHPYGHPVNLLDPADVNHKFQSTVIHPGTSANILTFVRRGDKLRIFVNGEYINQVIYAHASVDRVGMFIGGQLAAEFRELTVRIAK
jgi:hypothetical protein